MKIVADETKRITYSRFDCYKSLLHCNCSCTRQRRRVSVCVWTSKWINFVQETKEFSFRSLWRLSWQWHLHSHIFGTWTYSECERLAPNFHEGFSSSLCAFVCFNFSMNSISCVGVDGSTAKLFFLLLSLRFRPKYAICSLHSLNWIESNYIFQSSWFVWILSTSFIC